MRSRLLRTTLAIALSIAPAALVGAGCSDDTTSGVDDTAEDTADTADTVDTADTEVVAPTDRIAGARTPRSAACDAADPARCLAPWPSNVFTVANSETPTGLRLAIDDATMPDDDPLDALNRADGFSRVSPIITVFPGDVLVGDGAVRVLVAEGDNVGTSITVGCRVQSLGEDETTETLVICYPRELMDAATEHVVVITDALTDADGGALAPETHAQQALGLDVGDPELTAYHAPARAALTAASIDASTVLRLWDFTTRSAQDPRTDLLALRTASLDALDAGTAGVAIDDVEVLANGSVAMIVRGRLTDLPSALLSDAAFARDADNALEVIGTHDAKFRIVVPAGEGDYRVVMYCHGTGGNVGDDSFDELMAENGGSKVAFEIDGWTDDTIIDTVNGLLTPISGGDRVVARVVEALAGGAALLHALAGPLGDTLTAEMIGGVANPAAGRRPMTDEPVWAGGSLGGAMGLIYSHLEPSIIGGVLNVPGTGFSHWLPASNLLSPILFTFNNRYGDKALGNIVIAMIQNVFDPMDGANWIGLDDNERVFLVQISIGDPVLPNVGSELVATSLKAVQVGAVLSPIVGVEPQTEAVATNGVTQFQVDDEGPISVHGFAARNTVAGEAARSQFIAFVKTLWAHEPVITVPTLCAENTPANSCDFRTETAPE